jgi:uncharacterized protein (TIGR02246 family)
MTDDADRQVREVLEEVYSAWDADDAEAFAKLYAESATATLPMQPRRRVHAQGRESRESGNLSYPPKSRP